MLNPCSLCKAECCKTYQITVTIFDLARIASKCGLKIQDIAYFHEPRLLAYDPDMVLDTTDGYGCYLLGLKSHPCRFLGTDDRCTVHDSAPLSCRRFPHTLSERLNMRFCPLPSQVLFRIKSSDIGADKVTRELEEHKKLVRQWNKKKGTREECLNYLIENEKAGGSR